jgi:hypothetical protein
MIIEELPFDTYPRGGREPIGRRPGSNTRHHDAPEFMKLTGVTSCAYCGLDFTASFDNWLSMTFDHVVPQSVCKNLGIVIGLVQDYSNHVLACAACNGYCNRYKPEESCAAPLTPTEFYNLRDKIFLERRNLILPAREAEKKFFDAKPWESEDRKTIHGN